MPVQDTQPPESLEEVRPHNLLWSPAFVFLSAQLLEALFCPHHKSCLILAQNLRAPSVEVGSKPAFRLLTGPLPCGSPQPSYQPAVRSQFCGLAVVHVMRCELDRGTRE